MNALLLHVSFIELANLVLLRRGFFVGPQVLLLFHYSHELLILSFFGVNFFPVNIKANCDDT